MYSLFDYKETAIRPNARIPFHMYRLMPQGGRLSVPLHWHHEVEIILPSTDGILEVDGINYPFVSGDILFINANQLHTTTIHHTGPVTHIVFNPESFSLTHSVTYFNSLHEKLSTGILFFPTYIPVTNPLNTSISPILNTLLTFSNKPTTSDCLFLNAYYHLLLATLYEADAFVLPLKESNTATLRYIKQAIQYMRIHLDEPMAIHAVSDYLGLSNGYFCRLFKAYTNTSPSQYFLSLKLEKACKLLLEGYSITATAQAVGIDHISYFNRLFKKHYGTTPSHYVSSMLSQHLNKQ